MNFLLRCLLCTLIAGMGVSLWAQSGKGEIVSLDAKSGNVGIKLGGRTQIYRTRASTEIVVGGARGKIADLVMGMGARVTSAEPGVATRIEAESGAFVGGARPGVKGPLTDRLLDTMWVWGKDDETITFREHGRIFWKGAEHRDFSWKVTSDDQRIVEGKTPSGAAFRIIFEKELTTGTVVAGNGGARQTRLVLDK